MRTYTPKEQKDFEKRAALFEAEWTPLYDALKKKHQCEMLAVPTWIRGPQGVFVTTMEAKIGDLKYKPIESPIADIMAS